MIGWFVGLSSLVKVALVGVLLVGGMQVRHTLTVRGLEKRIAEAEAKRDQEVAANAALRLGLEQTAASLSKLEDATQAQNRAIATMRTQARAMESLAESAALRALREGEQAVEHLQGEGVPAGPDAMNAWLSERLR